MRKITTWFLGVLALVAVSLKADGTVNIYLDHIVGQDLSYLEALPDGTLPPVQEVKVVIHGSEENKARAAVVEEKQDADH